MRSSNSARFSVLVVVLVALLSAVSRSAASLSAIDNPLDAVLEAARKTHNEAQLQSLKTQFEHKVTESAEDVRIFTIFHPGVFTIMHPRFSPSCTHRFHDQAPT